VAAKKSTNVRFLTLAFRTFEVAAPGVGSWLVDRLWFRLPSVPEKARRLRVELPPGTPIEVPFEDGLIRGTAYGDGPTVYLVHGWGGWGLQLAAMVPPLVDEGFRVVAYDAPSHGDSEPGREGRGRGTMPELGDAVQAVIGAQGEAYGIVAHSLGAPAVIYALDKGLAVERLVFVSSPTDFTQTLDQFQQALGFGPRIRAGFLRRFARRFGPMEDFEAVSAVGRLLDDRVLPELLLIHDKSDRETAYEGSIAIAAVWPGACIELTEGLGHRRVLADPEVVASVRRHLVDRAPGDEGELAQGTMRG
jgi:pimeloyl-ACP methyl ester carboxylesterase